MENIKIHSVVDLITNSSTTIYTYSEKSESVVRELVEEMLSVFGSNKKFDDLFKTVVMCSSYYAYESTKPQDMDYQEYTNIIDKVKSGEIEKTDWMKEAENQILNDYNPSTKLYLIVKDKKYDKLAKKIINFLYSTDHEACYE